MSPAVLSAATSVVSNSTRTLASSEDRPDDEEACPWIEKTSSTSDCPMFDSVPLDVRSDLNALVIVLSFEAKYLFIAITKSLP